MRPIWPTSRWTHVLGGVKAAESAASAGSQGDCHAQCQNGQFDCRASLCANEENCKAVAEAALAKAGFTAEGSMEPGHHTPAEGPFIQTLLRSYETYSGRKGECLAMGRRSSPASSRVKVTPVSAAACVHRGSTCPAESPAMTHWASPGSTLTRRKRRVRAI